MDDAGGVRFFESTGNLECDIENLCAFASCEAGDLSAQRNAVDVFSGDVVAAVVVSDFVNREMFG